MHVGTQFKERSSDDYRVFAQLGVNHICGYPPGQPKDWTVNNLANYKDQVESFGLHLDFIPLPLNSDEVSQAENPNIMLGRSPERDKEIELIQTIIRNCSDNRIDRVFPHLFLVTFRRQMPSDNTIL